MTFVVLFSGDLTVRMFGLGVKVAFEMCFIMLVFYLRHCHNNDAF
jgi:hypothetical protein